MEQGAPERDLNIDTKVEVNIVEPQLEKLDLGNAFGFRIQLDAGSDQLERQIKLINELRMAEGSPMIAIQEGTDTVLGFFWTEGQLEEFKKIVSQYKGSYGIGASYGESQAILATDGVEQNTYIATCEATNGAARAQKSELAKRAEGILDEGELFAYRYFIPEDDETTQKLISEGKVVIGAKGTLLEKISVTDGTLAKESDIHLPENFLTEIDSSGEVREELTDVTKLAILSIDINGFSNIVHQKTLEYVKAKQNNATSEEIQSKKDEIQTYLNEIAKFFTTLETHTRQKLYRKNPFIVVDDIFRTMEWRGDATGMILPTLHRDLLLQSITEVVGAFPSMSIKATLKDYGKLELVRSKDNRTRAPGEVDEFDNQLSKQIKEKHLNDEKKNTIIAEEGTDGQTILTVYERGEGGKLVKKS